MTLIFSTTTISKAEVAKKKVFQARRGKGEVSEMSSTKKYGERYIDHNNNLDNPG